MSKSRGEIKHNELSKDAKKSMLVRCVTAAVALIVILPCVFLGDWLYLGLVCIIGILSSIEIIRCAKRRYSPILYIVSAILVIALAYWPILRGFFEENSFEEGYRLFTDFDTLYLSIFVLVVGFCLVLSMVLIDSNFTVRDACFIFVFLLILALGMQSAIFLRNFPLYVYYQVDGNDYTSYFNFYDSFLSSMLFIYVAIGTFVTDAGAYFIGIFFGKNKMNERISPKKTWEGFVGGIFFSFAISFSFGMILAATGHPLLNNVLDLEHWYYILILSLLMPLIATFGDFVFSSAKRYYDIKDYGSFFPGHGGVLDRIDSLLFTMIVTAIFTNIVANATGIGNLLI